MRGLSAIGVVVSLSLVVGCSHSGSQHVGGTDGFGDPYITDAQGAAIKIGQSAASAFTRLGGEADSGYNGNQATPPLSYDYPIVNTGNPDDVNDTKTIWWQICVENGKVSGKQRGPLDSLGVQC